MKPVKVCAIPLCTYPSGECAGLCWHPDEQRADIIGQNGPTGEHYAIPDHDATRRPQSRFAAGAIPFKAVDDPAMVEVPEPAAAMATQVGGGHYKDMAIQPIEYIHKNGIGFVEGAVIKYVSRWRKKNGLEDLRKARHMIDLLIEMETLK